MKKVTMKKTTMVLTALAVISGLGMQASAQELSPQKVQRLDRKMTPKRAVRKRFRTQKEYQQMKRRGHTLQRKSISARNAKRVSGNRHSRRYVQESWVDEGWQYPRGPRQRGYRHFKRGWYLAYRYDRAAFYDRYGYSYGYFNRHGFEFDGIFYAYDRYYSYKDRMRGRGIFDGNYYMPANAARYGFCPPRPTRLHPRPFP